MDNLSIPKVVRIGRISRETPDIKTISFRRSAVKSEAGSSLKKRERYPFTFLPGQFLEISCFGAGEAPISISSSPHEEFLEISFKRIGSVTEGLFGLERNDSLGIRGPFGNGFPLEQFEGKDLLIIGGGMGLAPLRSLVRFILSKKKAGRGDIVLLYGSRSPADILYKKDLEDWARSIKVLVTVDKADAGWRGRVGMVTQLLDKIEIEPSTTKAVLCGPEVMMRFATAKLIELGMVPADIVLSLERYMKCGAGKCGHCYIADKFVCRDGPVFTYEELNSLVPAEILW